MRLIFAILCAALLVGCADNERHASKEDIEVAKDAARREAAKVLEAADGSMEQERLILSVRALESNIRRAGFEECADSFAAEAQRVMTPVLDGESNDKE